MTIWFRGTSMCSAKRRNEENGFGSYTVKTKSIFELKALNFNEGMI